MGQFLWDWARNFSVWMASAVRNASSSLSSVDALDILLASEYSPVDVELREMTLGVGCGYFLG
jgi:hypothetical protein